MAKIESAERELRYAELLALAAAFSVSLNELLGLNDLPGRSRVSADLDARLIRMRQEEVMLEHRLEAVEQDLGELERQRMELSDRLTSVREELPTLEAAYRAATSKS